MSSDLEKNSSKEEKAVQHRSSYPKLSPTSEISEEARKEKVDRLLKKKNLSLVEMQYIYDFLMDTGKEKWRYIKGYEGVYRISSTGIFESCRYGRILSPTQRIRKESLSIKVLPKPSFPTFLEGYLCGLRMAIISTVM